MTADYVDSMVSAELPPAPEDAQDEEEAARRQRHQDIVSLHGERPLNEEVSKGFPEAHCC